MTAYYNEIDPFAAAWLRNLIAADLIAPGVVDQRDIRNIKSDELEGYTQCHFFAGIGGWSLALRMAGWPDDRPVWTGSCPCQPLSSAGQRKGHADERHLWPAFFDLIAERRPATVFGEQVASKDGRNGSPEYVLIWKAWDMPAGPPICALRASARRTSGSDCIGWATPRARDHKGNGMSIARVSAGKPADTLDLQCKLASRNGMAPPSPLHARMDRGASRLNPRFSLWLMGYPAAWASCAAPVTRSFRK